MTDGKTGMEKTKAKLELSELISLSMPKGQPDWRALRYNIPVATLVAENGKKEITMVLICLLRDFCDSFNVVRNMTEDQIIDAATMLRDECGDYRMEDYAVMLTMAKRNHLGVKILDRLDISTIGQVRAAYDAFRREGIAELTEREHMEYERSLKSHSNVWIVNTRLSFFPHWACLTNAYEYWRVKPLRDLRMKLSGELVKDKAKENEQRKQEIGKSQEKINIFYEKVLKEREKQKQQNDNQ